MLEVRLGGKRKAKAVSESKRACGCREWSPRGHVSEGTCILLEYSSCSVTKPTSIAWAGERGLPEEGSKGKRRDKKNKKMSEAQALNTRMSTEATIEERGISARGVGKPEWKYLMDVINDNADGTEEPSGGGTHWRA